jgi:hypothetical protein
MADFERALQQAQQWLDADGVDGVGEGEEDGERVIDVWVRRDALSLELPDELEGIPVRVRDSGGGFQALADDEP